MKVHQSLVFTFVFRFLLPSKRMHQCTTWVNLYQRLVFTFVFRLLLESKAREQVLNHRYSAFLSLPVCVSSRGALLCWCGQV